MTDKSSYLRYLPPVLWEKESASDPFSLGAMLRIFEKLLTGIAGEHVITHKDRDGDGEHAHEPIAAVIARLHELFDPWRAPAEEFLPWLASWLALEFPTLQGQVLWDEYQQRKITSEIVQIYGQRGLKAGLNRYLDLYTVADKRPRIAVDDGSTILFTRPQPGRFAPLYTLNTPEPSVYAVKRNGQRQLVLAREGLVRPVSIALGPDGSLLVADLGTPEGWAVSIKRGVWQLPAPWQAPASAPARPKRIGPAGWERIFPVALVANSATPWQLYLLDRATGESPALYELNSSDFSHAPAVATASMLGITWPMAMALDRNGHLLILDRGELPRYDDAGKAVPTKTRIIDVQLEPFEVKSRDITNFVVEPLSLLVLPDGALLIGDGRDQNTVEPADLVHIDRTDDANWQATRLLENLTVTPNPLVAPVALAGGGDQGVFVLDLGLKPYRPDLDSTSEASPFLRHMAEPAAVYRVTLGPLVAVERASETGQLVYPVGMVLHQGTLYIADQGEYSDPTRAGALLRVWRAAPHEFGVVVYFSQQHPTNAHERGLIVQNIRDIVNREKPAHADWTLIYPSENPEEDHS